MIFSRKAKFFFILIQGFAAGLLAYCLLNIGFWMEDSYSLREMSKSYEETDLFFRQVDGILRQKIDGQDNRGLFETDGVFDGQKEIDIQSYGKGPNAVRDLNTTYLLSDILGFCEDGSWQVLRDAVQSVEGEGRQEAGEKLDAQSAKLETIRPVTGISLSECSRWYSDSAGFVLDMYMKLEQTCSDIYARYQQYTLQQDESWSAEAPSNLRYCIENSSTGEVYTNLSVSGCGEAAEALETMPEFSLLYEGERSFNIMVANPDSVLNAAAGEWFLNRRFVNTNERVLIAVDMSYPVSDSLRTYADYFASREGIVWGSVFGVIVSGLVLLTAFVLSLLSTGWEEGRLAPQIYWIDRIPTELAAAIYMTAVVLVAVLLDLRKPRPEAMFDGERLAWAVVAAAVWLVWLTACSGFARRLRAHKLWHNSICRMLLYTWKKVTAARAASGQLLVLYVVFFVLNFLFLLLLGRVGIFLVLVLDLAVLLYLLRDMAGKQSVWEGIHQISKGDLAYRIDTTALTGETYEMAKAVNEMGDGLQEAVDAIVKNERLKAELITNVSHDLKTPLTSIVSYVDLLKRENLPGERVQHCIEVLDQKSQRLKQLTEDLVEVSKISSGNVELHMMKIEVQSMLDQAYGEFEERLQESGHTVKWELEKEPLHIMADGRQFWRILENLFGNICKYALEGSQVDLILRREEDQAVVIFRNVCREKPEVDAQELMGRFVRGDRSRNTEGSGLGLSIAQSLTELQGGSFRLELPDDRFCAVLQFPLVE